MPCITPVTWFVKMGTLRVEISFHTLSCWQRKKTMLSTCHWQQGAIRQCNMMYCYVLLTYVATFHESPLQLPLLSLTAIRNHTSHTLLWQVHTEGHWRHAQALYSHRAACQLQPSVACRRKHTGQHSDAVVHTLGLAGFGCSLDGTG